MSKLIRFYTLSMFRVIHVNYTSIKLFFFKLTFHHFQRIDWRGGSGTLGGSETKVLSSLSSSEGDVF